MALVTTAIAPIVLLLAAGAFLRRRFLRDAEFWRGLEWTSYRVFTPALFITSLAQTDLDVVPIGPMVLSLAVPILAVAALVLGLRRPMRADGPELTSMVQGAIRINTYIGLIFAGALHGQEGVATFALAAAVVVPLVNVICVSVLAVHGDASTTTRRLPIWRELLENPLIQGCAIGLAVNVLNLPLPGFASATLDMLAAPAVACGTLVAGAALQLSRGRRDILDIAVVTVLKLVVLPFLAAAIAISLGIPGGTLTIVVVICGIPAAPSAYVLASRMGGDTRLMASITGVQTVAAMATLPVLLAVVEALSRR